MFNQQVVEAVETTVIIRIKPDGTVAVDVKPPKTEEKLIVLAH